MHKPLPKLAEKDHGRFTASIAKMGNGCWEWRHSRTDRGYGVFRVAGGTFAAHRIAYMNAHGVDPGDKLVCHSCDNPPCVNPSHLWLGTDYDNAADRQRKGRWNGGNGKVRSSVCIRCGHKRTDDYIESRNGKSAQRCRACVKAKDEARSPRKRFAKATGGAA